jgi:hypothetical protein
LDPHQVSEAWSNGCRQNSSSRRRPGSEGEGGSLLGPSSSGGGSAGCGFARFWTAFSAQGDPAPCTGHQHGSLQCRQQDCLTRGGSVLSSLSWQRWHF